MSCHSNFGRGWSLMVALAVVLPLLSVSRVEAEQFGDITVRAVSPPITGVQRSYGYWEQRVVLINDGDSAHRIRLRAPVSEAGGTFGGGASIGRLTAAYDLPAHSRRDVSLLMPPLQVFGNGMTVFIDGRRQRFAVSGDLGSAVPASAWWGGGSITRPIILSPHVSADVRVKLSRLAGFAVSPTSSRYRTVQYQLSDAGVSLEQWPTHWLGYSSYAAVVITAGDLTDLPPAKRRALWKYVRCGGFVLLLDGEAGDIPATWRGWGAATTTGSLRSRAHTSRTVEVSVGPVVSAAPGHAVTTYHVGFGLCWIALSKDVADWNRTDWKTVQAKLERPAKAMEMVTPQNANAAFPVVEHLSVPVRGLLAILAVFALLVGPIALVVLTKLRRKLYLWVTTPAISLVFSLGVFGYALAAEGWTPIRRVTALTILDQHAHEATTIGWIGYYAPLTPSSGLDFSTQTELTPEVAAATYRSSFTPREIDWTNGQHLGSGWVSARVPALFAVRKAATSRARVVFSRDAAGTLTAVNGLGRDIQALMYADGDGAIYTSGPIAAGASVQLKRDVHLSVARDAGVLRGRFRNAAWPGMISRNAQTLAASVRGPQSTHSSSVSPIVLRPNCYLASLSDCPFIQPGLADATVRPAPSLVYGVGVEVTR